MKEKWIYLNGDFVDDRKAALPVLDRGLLFGDGAFETLRSYNGRLFAFDLHARRLFEALSFLRIPIPESEENLSDAARELLRRNGLDDAVVRITVTRGPRDGPLGLPTPSAPTRIIHSRPLVLPENEMGVAAVIASRVRAKAAPLAGIKSLNYLDNLIARQEASERGAFEALLLNGAGEIVEGASSNVFAVFNGAILTPPLSAGALPGVTRALVLEMAARENIPLREEAVRPARLKQADEIFITNSVIEILPVGRLDDCVVGDGKPGPVTRRLRLAYSSANQYHNE